MERLSGKEKIILALRDIYAKYGYLRYEVNRFEEYDLYSENKDFLLSNRVITFTDTDGKLLALKPDVTLSIIKNCKDLSQTKKYFYDESVYRISASNDAFKEITQAGLECLGDVDDYQIYEVLTLALESLNSLSKNFVLSVANVDVALAVIDSANLTASSKAKVLRAINAKSISGVKEACEGEGVDKKKISLMCDLIRVYGSYGEVKDKLDRFKVDEKSTVAVEQFLSVLSLVASGEFEDKVKIDFSVVNDINYYNGIVFNGVIEKVASKVLSGGQYDKLMQKMNKGKSAIGFAVYVDLLERLEENEEEKITFVIYDDKTDRKTLIERVNKLNKKSAVRVQKTLPNRDGKIIDLREEK